MQFYIPLIAEIILIEFLVKYRLRDSTRKMKSEIGLMLTNLLEYYRKSDGTT